MVVDWRKKALSAFERGDPLGVLSATEREPDPLALAVRAAALAQLDELGAARRDLLRAERELRAGGRALEALRAGLAEAEIAVWDLDLVRGRRRLLALAALLRGAGDHANAAWALLVAARAAHLQGDAEGAGLLLARCREEAAGRVPAHVEAVLALAEGEHFARTLAAREAEDAVRRARDAARRARSPVLAREIARFAETLAAPVARLSTGRALDLAGIAEVLSAPSTAVIDACRARVLIAGRPALGLASKPLLFELLAALARVAPRPLPARDLLRDTFGVRVANASHDARLRVELGRLRELLGPGAGRVILERRAVRWEAPWPVVVLEPLVPREEAPLSAVLADGRAWPVRALAEVLGQSPRTVQRRLAAMAVRGAVSSLGRGRARRWTIGEAAPRIASWILLPAPAPARYTEGGARLARRP